MIGQFHRRRAAIKVSANHREDDKCIVGLLLRLEDVSSFDKQASGNGEQQCTRLANVLVSVNTSTVSVCCQCSNICAATSRATLECTATC